MKVQGIWKEASPYQQLVLTVILVIMGGFVFTILAGILVKVLFGINLLTDLAVLSQMDDPRVLGAMKLMQGVTAFGTFVVPPLFAAYTFSDRPSASLSLEVNPSWPQVGAIFGLVLVSTPLINWMMVWNQQMQLPGSLRGVEEWMKSSEAKAAALTEAFMRMPTVSDLLINLLIIGLLPAIGEELLFRGLIQPLMKGVVRNRHIAIFLTSVLFSAMHMQFYGFLPRFALGLLLGYLVDWTGSLRLSMLLHLLINGSQVLITFFFPAVNPDEIGTGAGEVWQLLLSSLLTAGLLYFIFRFSNRNSGTAGESFTGNLTP